MTRDSGTLANPAAATPREAERRACTAVMAFNDHARTYSSSRQANNEGDTNRKRMLWGIAGFDCVNKLLAIGEAEDACDAAANSQLARLVAVFADILCSSAKASPEATDLQRTRGAVQDCWSVYHNVRTDPARDAEALQHVRDQLERALAELLRLVGDATAAQDRQHMTEVRGHQEQAMALHPTDAFPEITGWTDHPTYLANQRTRHETLQRDRHRYGKPPPDPPTLRRLAGYYMVTSQSGITVAGHPGV